MMSDIGIKVPHDDLVMTLVPLHDLCYFLIALLYLLIIMAGCLYIHLHHLYVILALDFQCEWCHYFLNNLWLGPCCSHWPGILHLWTPYFLWYIAHVHCSAVLIVFPFLIVSDSLMTSNLNLISLTSCSPLKRSCQSCSKLIFAVNDEYGWV